MRTLRLFFVAGLCLATAASTFASDGVGHVSQKQSAKINGAIALLNSIGISDVPDIDLVGCIHDYALACITPGNPTIHLTKNAVNFNVKELAAFLAHERLHVLGELHEGPGYDEQTRVLKRLGGSAEALERVRLAHELYRFDYPPPPPPPAQIVSR